MEREWKKYLVPLSDAARNADDLRKEFWKEKAEVTIRNLRKNDFEACYAENREEAAKILLDLIPEGAVVGCGDSHTLFALNVEDQLIDKNCIVISHVCALNKHAVETETGFRNKDEVRAVIKDILQHYLTSDVFILGAGAITVDGQIINTDGRGNRIAGSIYGPDRIIVVAGVNKIVADEKAGRQRIGFISAPMNHLKYGRNQMPCIKAGICTNCNHPNRSCHVTSIIHKKPQDSDFYVILIGEELGF